MPFLRNHDSSSLIDIFASQVVPCYQLIDSLGVKYLNCSRVFEGVCHNQETHKGTSLAVIHLDKCTL